MTYSTFDAWFDAVQQLTPGPINANDQWYDAYLCALDPRQAVSIVRPVQVQGWLNSLWVAIKLFFS